MFQYMQIEKYANYGLTFKPLYKYFLIKEFNFRMIHILFVYVKIDSNIVYFQKIDILLT